MSHTPGPWSFIPEDNLVMTYAGRHVAEFQPRSTHVSLKERNANGNLIAAAPELLAALERIIQLNEQMPADHPMRLSHGEEKQAIDAITKARRGK